jgi:glycosyltransferase involved in cell wall biosynthesis
VRILVIGSDVPFRRHTERGVTAINIVSFELMKAFVNQGHQLLLQIIFNSFRQIAGLQTAEAKELTHLQESRVTVLPPIYPREYLKSQSQSRVRRILQCGRRIILPRFEDYYPTAYLGTRLCQTITSSKVDGVLVIWSPEGLAATHYCRGVPRISYQGDIDFVPNDARLKDQALFAPRSKLPAQRVLRTLSAWRQKISLTQSKKIFVELMNRVDVIANVTASNVDFYKNFQHPRSIYVGNTWSDSRDGRDELPVLNLPPQTLNHPIKIIGHIGHVHTTGSTYGLKFLLADVVPLLQQEMNGLDYQIHIIGDGELPPTFKALIEQNRIIRRGFVPDLDSELVSSDMLLLLNNANPYYNSAFTRHIVAWSMGLCLVVHSNSIKAIPEIRNMENALVGTTPEEIAQLIYRAATDRALNQRMRVGGRATFEKYFAPSVIAARLAQELAEAAQKRNGRQN